MINLSALADLHHQHDQPPQYCAKCDRWVALDLAGMIGTSHNERRLPLTVRCQVRGEVGRLQVRLPVPTRRPGGWMELRQ